VREEHSLLLSSIDDEDARADKLCELNVQQQVRNISNTSIIRDVWAGEGRPVVHGWIYGLKDGLLKKLIAVEPTFLLKKE
jgi:carbonic anhydrase